MNDYELKLPSGTIFKFSVDRSVTNVVRFHSQSITELDQDDRGAIMMWCVQNLPVLDTSVSLIFTADDKPALVMAAVAVVECSCENYTRDRQMAEKAKFN